MSDKFLTRCSVVLNHLPKALIDLYITKPHENTSKGGIDFDTVSARVCKSLWENLKEYQKDNVIAAVKRNARVLLSDDMGLGKTLVSLAIADFYFDSWPLLVITTKSGRTIWIDETKKWYADSTRFPSEIDPVEDSILVIEEMIDLNYLTLSSKKIIVTSFCMLQKHKKEFFSKEFKFIIIDESHSIKSQLSYSTRAVSQLVKRAQHVLLVSGTPALSNPKELYTQIKAVDPRLFNEYQFDEHYCRKNPDLTELKSVLYHYVALRNERSVEDQLGKKERIVTLIDAELDSSNLRQKLAIAKKRYFYNKSEKRTSIDTNHVKSYIGLTCDSKIAPVCRHIENILKDETNVNLKIIVVAYHQKMLDALEKMCLKNDHDCIKISGLCSSAKRSSLLNKFKNSKKCMIALLSLNTLSSFNLNESTRVIFAELYSTPGRILRAEDRVLRIGQTNKVTIEYLIAEKTIDPYLYELIKQRLGENNLLLLEVHTELESYT